MDIEKIKDSDDVLLIREIVERLPLAIVVIDHAFHVQYMNSRFQEIFDPPASQLLPMDRGKPPSCMGHILGCSHNGSGNAMEGRGSCRHCQFRIPVDTFSQIASQLQAPEVRYTVVKEFLIHGKKVLKYLEIQQITLSEHRVMLLVDDQTQAVLATLGRDDNGAPS